MDTHAQFIEDVALHWEQQRLPRMAGRILGLLMVCDPPWRSAAQLREELGASKGSISTMIRLLLAAESIEAVAVPGERATHYRLSASSLVRKLEKRLTSITGFQSLAERALALQHDASDSRAQDIRRIAKMYAFLERELPLLLERWREESGGE